MSSVLDSFRGLVRSAVVIFIGTLLGRGLSLVGELLIIRSLNPETFGVVALAYTSVLTVARIGFLGVPRGVARMLSAEGSDGRHTAFIKSGYAIVLGSGLVIAVGLYLFRGTFAALMGTDQLADLTLLFVPVVLLFPVARMSVSILRAKRWSVAATISQDFAPRVGAILTFLLFTSLGRPFDGAIAYWVVTPVLSAILATVLLSRIVPVRSGFSGIPPSETAHELWSFSWPLAIAVSLTTLMSTMDVLMIGYFLDSEPVGFYRSVQPFRQVSQFVLQSFVFLFLPLATEYYSKGDLGKLGGLYRVASKWIALLTLPFVLVFSLFSSDVIRVFLGEGYVPAASALSVLTAGLFFNALVGPNGAMIQAMNRPRIEMYAAGVGVTINLLLNVLLIPLVGIVGAALATVFGYVAFNTAEVVAIYLVSGTHPFSKNSLQPLIVTTLVGIGIVWATRGMEFGVIALLGIGIGLSIVAAAAVFLTQSLDETDELLITEVKSRIGLG